MLSCYYTCHTIPPSLILGLHHQWSLYSTYTHSLSHTNACTNTHRHTQTPINLDPHLSHVRMCISHTHSLIMYMCIHVTQHKAPCTCLSLSSTHIDTKNLLSLPQSLTYHTRTLSLSPANTLNKGFPVNNLPSIHQQSWQYSEDET